MRRVCVALTTLALLGTLFPTIALAGKPGTTTIALRGMLSAENQLEMGYTIGAGYVVLQDKPRYDYEMRVNARVVMTADEASAFHLYLRDVTCSSPRYLDDGTSDGSTSVDHATITTLDRGVRIDIRDSGPGCGLVLSTFSPTLGNGNLSVTKIVR